MTNLSIVLPVYNALEYLKKTISNIKKHTHNDYELIIIDDNSEKETKDYIYNLKGKNITKIFNNEQNWVNHNWNIGAFLAKGEYIAFINSDIEVSGDWDKKLIKDLERSTIASPFNPKDRDLVGTYQEYINGTCFMIESSDRDIFPIPDNIKHWFGDNYLAKRALSRNGNIVSNVETNHAITKSGQTVPTEKYLKRIYADYETFSEMYQERILEVEAELIRVNKTLDKPILMPAIKPNRFPNKA